MATIAQNRTQQPLSWQVLLLRLQTRYRLVLGGIAFALVAAGTNAGTDITTRVVMVAVVAFGLAALVTYLSFWLRRNVKRYITLGIVRRWCLPGVSRF
jgi:hypothetical protein